MAAKRDVGLRARPFAIAAIEARYALERSSWTEAAALQPRPNPWAFIEAVPHFARAVGASRSGNPAAAKADIDRLTELQADLAKSNITYWARVVDIQLKIASAWMADAEGRSADALSLMQAAADLEKSIDTHDTLSPGPVGATAHESLGELLLKAGRAREAFASFEESLKLAKDRARSYFGAAKAAGLAGDADRQKAYVAKLAEVCGVPAATTSPPDGTDAQLSMLPCAWLTR